MTIVRYVATFTLAISAIVTSNPAKSENFNKEYIYENTQLLCDTMCRSLSQSIRLISSAAGFGPLYASLSAMTLHSEAASSGTTGSLAKHATSGFDADNIQTASVTPVDRRAAGSANKDDVFGSVAIPFKRLGALSKARPTFHEISEGTALQCESKNCLDLVNKLKAAQTNVDRVSVRDRMNMVNVVVNRAIQYRKDSDTYGEGDKWASPRDTMQRMQGDCEDYALLKLAALNALGIPLRDMSVVVIFDQRRHFYHAVLSVAVGDNRFILDNMRDQILRDRELADYQPLFSISDGKAFLHGSRVKSQTLAAVSSFDRISPGEGAELEQ